MKHFAPKLGHRCTLIERLDSMNMSHGERERAKAYLQQGERFAEIAIVAGHNIRSAAAAVQHGAARLARNIKKLWARSARTRRRSARMASPH